MEHGWVGKENVKRSGDTIIPICDGDVPPSQHVFDDTLSFFRAYHPYKALFALVEINVAHRYEYVTLL